MYGRRQPRGVRAGELHGGEQVHSGASSLWQRAEVGADHPDRDGPAFFCGKCAGCPVREAGFSREGRHPPAVKSGRRKPSAFHKGGRGLPTPSARLFSWRTERTGRMMHRRKRSWLPVLCVLLAALTACTWRRNSPRCTTAAASCAETCCVPACPSGIIMVSFCKEVDPCEI